MLPMLAMVVMGMDSQKPFALAGDWKLAWHEEFNYKGLPDPKKWGYEVGYIRNDEAQYYTKARLDNASVGDGHLTITGLKDNFEGHKITSASITTYGKRAFKYGFIEVRAKVPTGKGTWPAIWTLGTNIRQVGWPRCGEIDIMENVGFDPTRIVGTPHWNSKATGNHDTISKSINIDKVWEGYHVFAVDWTPTHLDFYIDKTLYHHFEVKPEEYTDVPFTAEHYLILNLAIGGSWGGQQGIDDSTFPAKYLVDYVRYFERK